MDTIMSLGPFLYAKYTDLNMDYFTMDIDEDANKICTTVLPWEFYQYNIQPMGLIVTTDIFQARMNIILWD